MRPHICQLRPLRDAAEWDRNHAIRQTCLFDVYHPWIPYDRHHPDDRDPSNHPLGFFFDGAMVGTIRIDLKPDGSSVFRMIAIIDECRGRHLGGRLMEMAEAYAFDAGATSVCLNSVAPAIGFYLHRGYIPDRWLGCTFCPTSTPMRKTLVPFGATARSSHGLAKVADFLAPAAYPMAIHGEMVRAAAIG